MRMCSIASGSSGNCIYVAAMTRTCSSIRESAGKGLRKGLKNWKIKGEELSGILITHEHSDHIQGLGVFSRKYGIPIYATPGTIEGILSYSGLGKMPEGCFTRYIRTSHLFWGM